MSQAGFFFARARARSTGRRAGRAVVVLLAVVGMLAQATPAQAFKPYTHVATGQAVLDDVADGEVTIGGRTYEVPHHVHTALTRYPSYFNAGVIGPDGFPDLTFGQSVIHSGQTGEWLEHLMDLATIPADMADPPEAALQALAWTYGFMLHTIGDMWAHTFVNELSGGVFPGVGEMAEDLSQGELDKIAIAVRHTILEGYIGDATPGYDGNPAPSEVDTDGDGRLDDVSSIATSGIDLDAPINFIYHALVNPERPLPVGTCGDGEGYDVYGNGVDDDGDGVVDDGCPHSINYTVGEPEPVRGPLIDFFLDLQSDLELARAEYAADERHTDCMESVDWDCYERQRTVAASTVRGLRSTTITVSVCEGAMIGCAASPTDGADDLIINEILIAYIDAWIDDIKTGLRHWPELGLAISRALFDPQTRRDIQDDLCHNEDYDQWSEERRECEDELGAIDYVTEETTDFQQDYLYSMLGAPDFVGSFAGTMADISGWISDAVGPTNNPISWAIDEVKDIAKEMIKEMIEERYGVDIDEIKAILHQPTKILYEGGLDLDTPDIHLPLFDETVHPRIDEVLGLPADHHESEDEGYRLKDDVELDPSTMPLFQNTVTLGKLAMLDGVGLDQVLSDMTGEEITYYQKFPNANIMTVGAGSDVSDAAPFIRGAADPITLGLDHPDRIMGTHDPAAVVDEAGMASTSLTSTLAALGDVNGDGADDFAIGAPTDGLTQMDYGAGGVVYVLFGPLGTEPAASDLALLNQPGGPSGFRVVGRPDDAGSSDRPKIDDAIGWALEAAGDVNGDGLADVLIGGGDNREVYIVYGTAETADITVADLQDPGGSAPGVWIDGFIVTGNGGGSTPQNDLIDSAGDFDGDGYDDVLIADEGYQDDEIDEESIEGAAVVLYGGPDLSGRVDLQEVLARRDEQNRPTGDPRMLVLVNPIQMAGLTPTAAAGVGDLDGDGLDDIALTVIGGYARGVYVVYGGTTLSTVPYTCTDNWGRDEWDESVAEDCAAYASTRDHWQGWRIGEPQDDPSPSWPYDGGSWFDIAGGLASHIVEGVGDMTGDGVPDLAYVAEVSIDVEGSTSNENPHVVMVVAGGDHSGGYGPALGETIRVLGARGDHVSGSGARTGKIIDIEPAGDVDGDGLQDLGVVSVAGAGGQPESHERHVAVVFGRDLSEVPGTVDIDLEQLRGTPSAAGVMIEGPALAIPNYGYSTPNDTYVAPAGDSDGDGRDEILIGVGSTSRDGVPGVGAVYHVGGIERDLEPDDNGEPTTDLVPWLRSIDGDHAWRSDGLPIFDRESGGNGNFPLWESCLLREPVFRQLFVDWENGEETFPDHGDDTSVILEGSTTAEACGLDGDGIESEIDGHMVDGSFVDESDAPSTRFTDQPTGGTTHGVVVDDGGLMVEAERHADGVALWATGTGGPATFELCQDPVWDLALSGGDSGIATCGSLTWRSTAGEAVVTSGDQTVSIPTGSIATMRSTDDGLVVVVPPESGGSVVVTGPDGSETIEPAASPQDEDEDDGSGGEGEDDGGGATPDPDPGSDGEPDPPLAEACQAATDAFVDDASSVHEAAIDCLAELGLLEGFADGTIRAGDDVTRGQAAGMLMRLVAAQRGEGVEAICPDGGDPLPDGGATFGAAIACLRRLGVVAGHADGTYRPNEDVTRSQAASLVARTASVLGLELPTGGHLVFDDVDPAGAHGDAIGRLAAAAILEGYDSTTFGPNDTLTRGQLASVLARLIGWSEQQPSG